MRPLLEIRGSNTQFEILHKGRVVAGPYTSHEGAIAAMTGVEQRLDPKVARFRKCTCCREGFMSTEGHVTCDPCRRRASLRRQARGAGR